MTEPTARTVQRAKSETINWLRGNPSDYFKAAFPEARYNYTSPLCDQNQPSFCAGAMLGAFINHLAGHKFYSVEGVGSTLYGDDNTFFSFTNKGIPTDCPSEAADYLESLVELPEYRLSFSSPTEDEQLQKLAEKLGYDLVKKTTPDTFSNWDALDPRFKFIARDQDGTVYAYTCKPLLVGGWIVGEGMGAGPIDEFFTGHTPGTCDWTESLIQRPSSDN